MVLKGLTTKKNFFWKLVFWSKSPSYVNSDRFMAFLEKKIFYQNLFNPLNTRDFSKMTFFFEEKNANFRTFGRRFDGVEMSPKASE